MRGMQRGFDTGINPFGCCNNLSQLIVSANHPSLVIIDGVLFSKSDKRLICCLCSKNTIDYEIPYGITAIVGCAFEGCTSLTSVTVPVSVTSIGGGAFKDCTSLSTIYYIGTEAQWAAIRIDRGTIPRTTNIVFTQCGDNVYWTLRDDALIIYGYGPMYNYSEFAEHPWSRSIKKVVINDGVTSIGDFAFGWCTDLTTVTIPDSVTSIGRSAFYECTSLTSLIIPVSVTSIGNAVFNHCTNLSTIYYKGTEAEWEAIIKGANAIPSTVTIVYNYTAP
ncbi:MAG: leucine-rich repeat domain-containing protein [Clostridia bacterium]|nr:leucine-rich repeat domain-containing protein [Clostridia bacterium]